MKRTLITLLALCGLAFGQSTPIRNGIIQGTLNTSGTPTGTVVLSGLTLTLPSTPSFPTNTFGIPSVAVTAASFAGSGAGLTGVPISTGISGLGTGVATWLATPSSANIAAAVTGETGSGALVFGTSPTLGQPVIADGSLIDNLDAGNIDSGTLNVNRGGTNIGSYAVGEMLYASGATTLSKLAAGGSTDILVGGGTGFAPVWTAATGTGSPVRAISPTLSTPVLGDATATSVIAPVFYAGANNGAPVWRSGAGTPEGAIAAPVGSLFSRTDGGAGTSLYVKESGSGNTGWVAK